MSRISRDDLFMKMAWEVSLRGTCERLQVGAVIVQDRRVVSMGYNGAPSGQPHCLDVGCEPGPDGGCIRALHAELNAVAYAARHGIPTDEGTMYCTDSICAKCSVLVIAAGIIEFVYERQYRLPEGIELLDQCNVIVRKYG